MANVLVIGSGAREHAIAATMLKSPQVTTVYCAPGNPGMKKDQIQIVDIDEMDFPKLVEFAKEHLIDLTFVGPEVPLSKGIVDAFIAARLRVFGPDESAARLESDKNFAKGFMQRNNIPTAKFKTFTDFSAAKHYADELSLPLVVKENGLAAGKGVTIVKDADDLEPTIKTALDKSGEILIEEFLEGEEFSLMLFVGGDKKVVFPISQDHKKIDEGETGPNTGGMGAYSPVPHITQEVLDTTIHEIVDPTMAGLAKEDLEFAGIIYVGCMLTKQGPKVIEYNLRLGDPETQVLLPQLESDFYQMTSDLIDRKLPDIKWQQGDFYLGVVVAAPGYPTSPKQHIALPADLPGNIFYAGVTEEDGKLYSSGGRIFTLYNHASTLECAQAKVYAELSRLDLHEFYYRKDIGFRDL
ncbi:Phosphoribosylamine--glycine ligase [Lentilactobacillus parabuchneri]|jgi:phosphoribosylamine--glycine ligase|uniref:Phosphoribosylamine--glycine ligase n=3 Tax=Lentilactobacillus TaxID=2767893 RepID=A0A1X1FGQ9_9LACO|nr:phosphoribosylamine--glycine ligase [Lentilactobacillus parabuchneri]APR06800.1 Phosphoribosylamine--glycine ligase [Lentilactobacillus parabuchneri]KRM46883.1 phosphoribosylamine--glycine ligase [Lentilactobacillus parabuchneri DSM 5707 = NBRC 107865]KRN78203.1 phosphoribosylamine--glycine ligase [Lentilactobacillus parabuchneri]MBW0222586.1 phosphoribosylamine--glycine ligase [Lentilactobacillus parabuchneri]MBW0245826.1 phosphoribosylamine--glycine ligase [Lentilactobacillus parabuchneri